MCANGQAVLDRLWTFSDPASAKSATAAQTALLTALFAQADAAHVGGGDGDAARFWLALLWPGILALGHQLDTCLRDLRFHDAACVLHVCVQRDFDYGRERAPNG